MSEYRNVVLPKKREIYRNSIVAQNANALRALRRAGDTDGLGELLAPYRMRSSGDLDTAKRKICYAAARADGLGLRQAAEAADSAMDPGVPKGPILSFVADNFYPQVGSDTELDLSGAYITN